MLVGYWRRMSIKISDFAVPLVVRTRFRIFEPRFWWSSSLLFRIGDFPQKGMRFQSRHFSCVWVNRSAISKQPGFLFLFRFKAFFIWWEPSATGTPLDPTRGTGLRHRSMSIEFSLLVQNRAIFPRSGHWRVMPKRRFFFPLLRSASLEFLLTRFVATHILNIVLVFLSFLFSINIFKRRAVMLFH